MKLTFDFKFEGVIDNLEKNLSRVEVLDNKIGPNYIEKNSKEYEILFTNSKFLNGKEIIDDQIFKLKNGLILYLSREEQTPNFKLKIYYGKNQINEIKMFLNTIKLWKE